ncbi:MAG TPA: class I SAM-dependent methyltransferase [Acidimicrobiia bacterium]|nr:class I SAM-dependent methyltransferase [Acidimicrobiia bacterium]
MTDFMWSLEAVTKRLNSEVPVIARGLLYNQAEPNDPRIKWAERAMEHVETLCAGDPLRGESSIEAFAITSLDFLRLQARFLKTGKYAMESAEDLHSLYSAPEMMVEYLDGLALSYAMWPNHASMLGFFVEEFVLKLPAEPRVLEIGPGHGLFAALLFEHRPNAKYVAIDISPSSLKYTERTLKALSIPAKNWRLIEADVTSPSVDGQLNSDGFDAVICSEVLEHVDRPEAILKFMKNSLGQTGKAFATTVANLEAVDHVFLFDSVEEIQAMIGDCGLKVLLDYPLNLPNSAASDIISVNYGAVVGLADSSGE